VGYRMKPHIDVYIVNGQIAIEISVLELGGRVRQETHKRRKSGKLHRRFHPYLSKSLGLLPELEIALPPSSPNLYSFTYLHSACKPQRIEWYHAASYTDTVTVLGFMPIPTFWEGKSGKSQNEVKNQ